jgi:hypothetical protein
MPRPYRCETCRFWNRNPPPIAEGPNRHRSACYRYPEPTPGKHALEWCGEHQPMDAQEQNKPGT